MRVPQLQPPEPCSGYMWPSGQSGEGGLLQETGVIGGFQLKHRAAAYPIDTGRGTSSEIQTGLAQWGLNGV